MLKLILKLPKGTDANLLVTTALALANYKAKRYYNFKVDSTDYADYEHFDLAAIEPERTFYQRNEYEVPGYMLDVTLTETLIELQKLLPFEMYFEQRGKFDKHDWDYGGVGDTFSSFVSA